MVAILVLVYCNSKRKKAINTTISTDVTSLAVIQQEFTAVPNAAYGVINTSTEMKDNIAYSALTTPVYDTVEISSSTVNKQYEDIDDYI